MIRPGELFLKGQNRPFFERHLAQNLKRAVRGLGGSVERLHGRVAVWVPREQAAEAEERLAQVSGLSSFSPALQVPRDPDAILVAAREELGRALAAWRGQAPPRFKVETHRADKSYPLTSPELNQRIGGPLVEEFGLPVDLKSPELRLEVEIGRELCFVASRRVQGAGGLPVGTAGPVTLLLSGGIDSPVAGYLLARRGCILRPITFESPPYTGPEARDKILDLCRLLARYSGPTALRAVRFTEAQLVIRRECPPRLAVVLYRRMMLRVAEQAARAEGVYALATGESLGQVASQTLENLHAISAVARLPVLRPLVTYDKAETVAMAERIGSYPISIRPHVDCCSLFVPEHPETRARLEAVEEAEATLAKALGGDLEGHAARLASEAELVSIPDPW
jgi:thiamine biosynthesis protein ThiI